MFEKRFNVCCRSVSFEAPNERSCFGFFEVLLGQKRVPLPPAITTKNACELIELNACRFRNAAVTVFETDHIVELRSRDFEHIAGFDCDHAMLATDWDVMCFA